MKTFSTEKPNTLYYVTSVTFNRVAVFRDARVCNLLLATFAEVRELFPYKLIAFVVMPDHFHAIVNPADGDISKWLLRVRGNSARRILDDFASRSDDHLLRALSLRSPQKRNHKRALWQKDPSIVDLESDKFILQKAGYIHANPVRAGLIDLPAKWPWSSCRSYLPHDSSDIKIEIDRRPYWTDEELLQFKVNVE